MCPTILKVDISCSLRAVHSSIEFGHALWSQQRSVDGQLSSTQLCLGLTSTVSNGIRVEYLLRCGFDIKLSGGNSDLL